MARTQSGWVLAGALAVSLVPAAAAAEHRFPVVFHLATEEGQSVVGEEKLQRLVETANAKFRGAELGFEVDEKRQLPDGNAVLETISDRRSLARFLRPRVINVFVVREILDEVPSEATIRAAGWQGFRPTGRLSGAHIPTAQPPGTYILLTARASATSLAHELGHFFGAGHHRDPENIMSYGAGRSRFSDRQLRAFRMFARRYARSGRLRPVPNGQS
ncbi:MAG: hypothetical protein AAGF12_09075 [Myxococcota bacterium]